MSSRERSPWHSKSESRRQAAKEAELPKILPATFFAAGHLLEQQGQIEAAVQQYRKALAVGHEYTPAYHRLGLLLSEFGRHDEALEMFQRAAALAPKNAVLRNNLGYELMLHEEWAQAERELTKAVELDANFSRAHINRGIVLSKLDRFDEALESFRSVLPEADAYYNLGLMYRGQKRYDEAAGAFARVLAIDPTFSAAITQLEQLAPRVDRLAWNRSPESEPKDADSSAEAQGTQDSHDGQEDSAAAASDSGEQQPGPVSRSDLSPYLSENLEWFSPLEDSTDSMSTGGTRVGNFSADQEMIELLAILRNELDCVTAERDEARRHSGDTSGDPRGRSRTTMGMTVLDSPESSDGSSDSEAGMNAIDKNQSSPAPEPREESDESDGGQSSRSWIYPSWTQDASYHPEPNPRDSEFFFSQYLGLAPTEEDAHADGPLIP